MPGSDGDMAHLLAGVAAGDPHGPVHGRIDLATAGIVADLDRLLRAVAEPRPA